MQFLGITSSSNVNIGKSATFQILKLSKRILPVIHYTTLRDKSAVDL